ncbi:uncharacterized protein LOC144341077 [Macaca mulatta]
MGRHWTAGSLRPLPPQGPLSKGGEHFSPAPLRNHLVRNKSHPPSVESPESADIHTAQGHHTWPSEARPGSGGSSHPGHTRPPAKEAGEGGRDPFLGVCWRPRERGTASFRCPLPSPLQGAHHQGPPRARSPWACCAQTEPGPNPAYRQKAPCSTVPPGAHERRPNSHCAGAEKCDPRARVTCPRLHSGQTAGGKAAAASLGLRDCAPRAGPPPEPLLVPAGPSPLRIPPRRLRSPPPPVFPSRPAERSRAPGTHARKGRGVD